MRIRGKQVRRRKEKIKLARTICCFLYGSPEDRDPSKGAGGVACDTSVAMYINTLEGHLSLSPELHVPQSSQLCHGQTLRWTRDMCIDLFKLGLYR
jgi:hypothetical protein